MRDEHTATPETGLPVSSLVVPLDGSPFGERCLATARWLSVRLGASVHLVSVAASAEEAAARRKKLRQLAARDGMSWEVVVAHDAPAEIQLARERLDPALVCMATHGRGRSAALAGSVAADLLHRFHRPLLLVGPKATLDEAAKRLVVGVDGSAVGEVLIPVAAAWAAALGLATSIVTVAEPVPESVREPGRYHRSWGPDSAADGYVAGLVARWRDHVPGVDGTAVYDPITPPGGLVGYFGRAQPALVVLGTHARSGLSRLLLGSDAATVVHTSPVPALVVPLAGRV